MTISNTSRGLRPGVCLSTNRPVNPFDGQVIYMTDVDQTAVWNGYEWTVLAPIAGSRNVVINGAFDVWQRGTAVQSNAGQGAYAADRWCGSHQFQTSRTQRKSISSPPSGLLSQYALRSSSSTTAQVANGSRMRIVQKLESSNSYRLRGQRVTLSFWVRFSNATVSSINNSAGGGDSTYGNFNYSVGSYTSTTDSATHTSAADTNTGASITNGSLPTTWTKYTLTATVSSTANNVDVIFGFTSLGSTTSADTVWFELAEVQLEAGSVATPFEFEDISTTLEKCQRYYFRIVGGYFGAGLAFSTTGNIINVVLPHTFRVGPTAVETTGTPANYLQVTSNTGTQACNSGPSFGNAGGGKTISVSSGSASAGLVQGNATFILAGPGHVFLGFSAEL